MSSSLKDINQAEYGRRLVPTLVDELARQAPDHVFASIPKSSQFTDGLIDVTNSMFACAVNRAAWSLESMIGRSDEFETIAYLGPGESCSEKIRAVSSLTSIVDIRYFVFMIAASKLGFKVSLFGYAVGHVLSKLTEVKDPIDVPAQQCRRACITLRSHKMSYIVKCLGNQG